MIKGFKCTETRALYEGQSPGAFRSFQRQAERKLQMLDSAVDVTDLRSPPGNRLERLEVKRKGQLSIRINDQWRVCFSWVDGAPRAVKIVDRH